MSEQKSRKKQTEAQRRARAHRRMVRKWKRRLKYIIPTGILAVATCAFLSFVFSSGSQSVKLYGMRSANNEPVITATDRMEEHHDPTAAAETATQAPIIVEETAETEPVIPEVPVFEETHAVEEAVPTEEPTAEPTIEPVPEPTPVPVMNFDKAYVEALYGANTGEVIRPFMENVDLSKRDRWPSVMENAVPIFSKAENMNDKVICVTVDDCYQGENLQAIVKCAMKNNAKLTIFPIGENLNQASVASGIRTAWENGMEIENHTTSHQGLYHFNDEVMTDEIWEQNQTLNKVLGVDYHEHFFRPHGGDERLDQRDHAYISQIGMYGLAHWSVDGSKSDIETNKNALKPGAIYLFHTTDNDRQLLLEFIPYAVSKGYKLITLNEMFGMPENETAPLKADAVKPELKSFRIDPVVLKRECYMRAVAVIQMRLVELGWLDTDSFGYYGKQTEKAVKDFQQASGLAVDGIAGFETQKYLLADDAKARV